MGLLRHTAPHLWHIFSIHFSNWGVGAVETRALSIGSENPFLCNSLPPHHPRKGAHSQIAREPVFELYLAPDLLWIWPTSLGKTDKSRIEGGSS